MRCYNLGFISDQDIYNHVRETVLQYRRSINLIRKIHENIISHIGNGWINKEDDDFDFINESKRIYVKTKDSSHSHSQQFTYMSMQYKILMSQPDTVYCYLLDSNTEISINEPWNIVVKDKGHNVHYSYPLIRRISIDRFYDLAFDSVGVYDKLSATLPIIINDVLEETR